MTAGLHKERLEAVLAVVQAGDAESVLDLGCGDGPLLVRLAEEPAIRRIVGVDLSADALARLRMKLDWAPPHVRTKVDLVRGSMADAYKTLSEFDAAILIEAIEHTDPHHLSSVERAVFREIRPETVVITTPNSDFNPILGVPPHRFRHPDHRFEWGRMKFRLWAEGVARRNDYQVTFEDVAGAHPQYGGATQMGIFQRRC